MQEKIIDYLKKSSGHLSGEEISRSLNISRAAIWKHMQELRRNGYDIVAVPHLGYKLVSCPDKLLPQEIQSGLKTKILGRHIVYYDTISSTMDAAFNLGVKGAIEGTLVCAESQTKGRGRLRRNWTSPKQKGIYISIILRPRIPPNEVPKLTLLCAVAVCEAINNISGIQTMIKWPNDIMVKSKKIAGILTELHAEADEVKFLIVGIGVNVNVKRDILPVVATSLSSESKKNISRVALTKEILRKIEEWYLRMQKENFEPIADRWRELSSTLHEHVRVTDSHGLIEGKAMDIDQDGGLLIRTDTGVMVKRISGDVTLVK